MLGPPLAHRFRKPAFLVWKNRVCLSLSLPFLRLTFLRSLLTGRPMSPTGCPAPLPCQRFGARCVSDVVGGGGWEGARITHVKGSGFYKRSRRSGWSSVVCCVSPHYQLAREQNIKILFGLVITPIACLCSAWARASVFPLVLSRGISGGGWSSFPLIPSLEPERMAGLTPGLCSPFHEPKAIAPSWAAE